MGKKYLRIRDRGMCPREFLEMLGATNKRDRINDHTVIGVNGTGTKFAAAAASRLGIGVGIASHDAQGSYFVTYEEVDVVIGDYACKRLVMKYLQKEEYRLPLPFTTLAGRNWDTPIGDDDKKTFRVLREYLSNAWDEDPHSTVTIVDTLCYAPDGYTDVYLAWHDEFEEIVFDKPERWFKRLGGQPPLFELPGTGAAYPKSDPDKTRIFSLGRLAACSGKKSYVSLHDWNVDDKVWMSEDGEFRDMTKTYVALARVCAALQDEHLARSLLAWVMEHEQSLEGTVFRQMASSGKPPDNHDIWLRAWHAQYDEPGGEAVIATEYEHDQTAHHSYRKRIVRVPTILQGLLVLCGVKTSRDFIPLLSDLPPYQPVEPSQDVLDKLADIVLKIAKHVPEILDVEFYFYVPLKPEARKQIGFTDLDPVTGKPTGRIGLSLGVMGSTAALVDTILHELSHLRRTAEHDFAFIDDADRQRGALLRKLEGIPEEPYPDFDAIPLGLPATAAPVEAPGHQSVESACAEIELSLDDLLAHDGKNA